MMVVALLMSIARASSIGSGYDILVGAGNGCVLHSIHWEKRSDVEPPDMGSAAVGERDLRRTYVSWIDRSWGEWSIEIGVDHSNDPPGLLNAEAARKAIFYVCGVPPLTELAWNDVLASFPPRLREVGLATISEWWGAMPLPPEQRTERLSKDLWQPFVDEMRDCHRSRSRCTGLARELAAWSARWYPSDRLLDPPLPREGF
jgi:hypothetical protein